MPLRKPSILRTLQWNNRFAHAQRTPPHATDNATIVAVASMDDRLLTSPAADLISLVINAEAKVPVVAIDADGLNQPLRGPLRAGNGGDLVGLSDHPKESLDRSEIELFVDQEGAMPLLACWKEGPGLIPSEVLESAVRRVQHRWPTVVMNLPYNCPPETISSGVAMANHVFLIADRHHAGHEWLYQPGHQLSTLARENRVTVLTLGGQSKITTPDTIHLPRTGQGSDGRDPIDIPTDPESLTIFHRILSRVYKS